MLVNVSRWLWSCTCTLVVLVTLTTKVVIGNVCSQCDCLVRDAWKHGGSVADIVMGCEEGLVTWYAGYGDLRMTLNPVRQGTFRVCILVESDVTTSISREHHSSTPSNYRRKTIGHTETKLFPLFTSKGRSKEHCISGSGPAQFYLQIERSEKSLEKVKIYYDVEKISSQLHDSSMEGCRPCTDRELLRSVCSSDFVAVGRIDDVTHDEDTSNIRVSVSRVISQKEPIFKKSADDIPESRNFKGVVHAPLKCGIRHGEGQFMFTGRVRLGQPVLQCAPRYEHWTLVLTNAVKDDALECSIDL